MGASGWSYFTPWQEEAEDALEVLHRQEEKKQGGSQMDLLMEAGEDMTHTILDIVTLTKRAYDKKTDVDLLTALAMPESWLMEMYGTLRPSREMVEKAERAMNSPFESLERGTAVYHGVWETKDDAGPPKWWYFYGCTGD